MVPRSRLLPTSGPAPGKNDGALRSHHPVQSCLELMSGSRVTDGWDWRPAVAVGLAPLLRPGCIFQHGKRWLCQAGWGVKWRVSVSFFCRRRETAVHAREPDPAQEISLLGSSQAPMAASGRLGARVEHAALNSRSASWLALIAHQLRTGEVPRIHAPKTIWMACWLATSPSAAVGQRSKNIAEIADIQRRRGTASRQRYYRNSSIGGVSWFKPSPRRHPGWTSTPF